MLQAALTIVATAADVLGIHNYITSFHRGVSIKKIAGTVDRIESRVAKISKSIMHLKDVREAFNVTTPSPKRLCGKKQIAEVVKPLQKAVPGDLLFTDFTSAPAKVGELLERPDSFLFGVTKLGSREAQMINRPGLVPIVFPSGGDFWIGWQCEGVLPLVLGCDYTPEQDMPNLITRFKRDERLLTGSWRYAEVYRGGRRTGTAYLRQTGKNIAGNIIAGDKAQDGNKVVVKDDLIGRLQGDQLSFAVENFSITDGVAKEYVAVERRARVTNSNKVEGGAFFQGQKVGDFRLQRIDG